MVLRLSPQYVLYGSLPYPRGFAPSDDHELAMNHLPGSAGRLSGGSGKSLFDIINNRISVRCVEQQSFTVG